ncbi:hypothetical protein YA0089_27335 [Pseudomonas viridiflava]|uniref:hypothetical protein n=1 Tax=Pseudomonas viridiflava TaxID=33069 RepID=UPI0018E602FF|nr:hypothetical protein [Pseudomonas viridiflava]MBI6727333.1 hypothetical protein [Pseudomonas viridiflava]
MSNNVKQGDITHDLINSLDRKSDEARLIFLAHSLGLLTIYRKDEWRAKQADIFGDRFDLKSHPAELRPALKIEKVKMLARLESEGANTVMLNVRQSPLKVVTTLKQATFLGDDFMMLENYDPFVVQAADWVLSVLNTDAEQARIDEVHALSTAHLKAIAKIRDKAHTKP